MPAERGPGGGDVPAAVAGPARAGRGAGAGGGRAAAPGRVAGPRGARAAARRRRPRRLLRRPLRRRHQPLPDAHAGAPLGRRPHSSDLPQGYLRLDMMSIVHAPSSMIASSFCGEYIYITLVTRD